MGPGQLPRALAVQYGDGEIVYGAGEQPELRLYSFDGMGLRTFGKTAEFLQDERFVRAHRRGWNGTPPVRKPGNDNRWILHTALWAAAKAAQLPGDFVECGVNTGTLSIAICDWLNFNDLDKDFWLFDTFEGIPDDQMTAEERAGIGGWHNANSYSECFEHTKASFSDWPRCRLVRGKVPDTLAQFPADRPVAYLSIDMNIVLPEIAAIEFFWDRLVPGAVVLLDDYAWDTHKPQKYAFDAFAEMHGSPILSLPTGQGLMIR